MDNGKIRLQQLNNELDKLRNKIETCKNDGYPSYCVLQIYGQTSSFKFEVYSIDVDENGLLLNGNSEVNSCSVTTLNTFRNRMKPIVECLLG